MTVLRVLYEEGRLDDSARGYLAEELTKAVLEVEVGADSELARTGVMVLFNEQPRNRWAVGGRFDDTHTAAGGRFLIFAQAMEGVWTAERRAALIGRFCDSVGTVLGIEGDKSALGSAWVLFDEVREGSWGSWGGAISIHDLLEPAGFTKDRCDDVKRSLGEPP